MWRASSTKPEAVSSTPKRRLARAASLVISGRAMSDRSPVWMPMNRKKSKPRRSTSYTTSSAASTPMSHPPVRKVSQSISEPCVYVMLSVRPCRENTPRATPAVTTTFDPVPNSITFREGMISFRDGVQLMRVRPVYTRVGYEREWERRERDADRSQHQAGGRLPASHRRRTLRGRPPPPRRGGRRHRPQPSRPCAHHASRHRSRASPPRRARVPYLCRPHSEPRSHPHS